jgi:hypothetical protein
MEGEAVFDGDGGVVETKRERVDKGEGDKEKGSEIDGILYGGRRG